MAFAPSNKVLIALKNLKLKLELKLTWQWKLKLKFILMNLTNGPWLPHISAHTA